MSITLYDYQLDAVRRLCNGYILCGGVGSGKSRTSLAYYYLRNGGDINSLKGEDYIPMDCDLKDLYIITTARKRDTKEWEAELAPFLMSTNPEATIYSHKVVIDSWNNIKKYSQIKNAFFIFDEQRVVGSGTWVRSFLNIAKHNEWILLSATPGDTWLDYIPVFVANGFYRNRSEFKLEHVVYKAYSKYPQVDRYTNTGRLIRLRNKILVDMDYKKKNQLHHEDIFVSYDNVEYKNLVRTRWDSEKNEPISSASEYCYKLRKIVNSDHSRVEAIERLLEDHKKLIIFYNFDYELDILKGNEWGDDISIAEWNGHKHQPIPETSSWLYLVQYNAGAEGWNCIKTDTLIFYSQNYSYKVMVQSSGRIDRLNTPFNDLYFYHLKSRAPIDCAIARALVSKRNFNESKYGRMK